MTHFDYFDAIPRFKYDLICADPPWRFETYSAKGKLKKSAELHYKTWTLDEISALPLADLASLNAALFLWATVPMLQEALAMMSGWGFTYKSNIAWGKYNHATGKVAFGTGYRIRNAHEHLLIGVRGNPKNTASERSLILSRVREHSRKPDEAAELMERWLPGARRIDLFGGRTTRPDWDSFGDQPGIFDSEEAA
jgi:N6-adenosine-specific RNA methylase IME4